MAGPLGEMFDHGIDALNTTLEVILCARALNLGRSRWTVASQMASLANFYLSTWEEYHTGTLYLGVFSGPAEGILLICGIYFITALKGTGFWDQGLISYLGLGKVEWIKNTFPDYALNEAFMVFGAFGLAFNIITSYMNVYAHQKAHKKSLTAPLLRLLPFPITILLQLLWLSIPSYQSSHIIHSPLFLPFLCGWGLQFAHTVGKMILAHVTKQKFPVFDPLWVWTAVLALDVNLPILLGRPPLFQNTPDRVTITVWFTLLLNILTYGHFVYNVIGDITNYLGIACFTVRKRDADGKWEKASLVDAKKKKV